MQIMITFSLLKQRTKEWRSLRAQSTIVLLPGCYLKTGPEIDSNEATKGIICSEC